MENGFTDMKSQLAQIITNFQTFAQDQNKEMEYIKTEAAKGINELHERENQTQDRELHLEDVEAKLELREAKLEQKTAFHEQQEAQNFKEVDDELLWLKDYIEKTEATTARLEAQLENSVPKGAIDNRDSIDFKLKRFLPDADFSDGDPAGAVTKQPFVSDDLIISGSNDEEALTKFTALQSHFRGNLLEKRIWFFAARPYIRDNLAHSYHALSPAQQNWKGLATLIVNAQDCERVNGNKTLEKNRLTPQPGESVVLFIQKAQNFSQATISYRNSFINDKINLIFILNKNFAYLVAHAKLDLINTADEFYSTAITRFTGLNFPTTTAVNAIEYDTEETPFADEFIQDEESDDNEYELAYIRRFNNYQRKPKYKSNYQSNNYQNSNYPRSNYQQPNYQRFNNYHSSNPFYQSNNTSQYQPRNNYYNNSKDNKFNQTKKFNPHRHDNNRQQHRRETIFES